MAEKSLKDVDGNAYARMGWVIHVVAAVVINDVNVIRVIPSCWPRVNEPERIAAVFETPAIVVALVDVKVVLPAKAGSVVLVRNATMIATAAVLTVTL